MSLQTLLTSAAFAPIENLGWILVTGSDRVRWLNGMVTNNIAALKTGEGCYNFFLNAQGRIQGDCTAWLLEDSILLEAAADRIPALIAMLDRFIIMDDVELTPIEDRAGLLIAGPDATTLIANLGLSSRSAAEGSPSSLSLHSSLWDATPIDFIQAHSSLVPSIELWSNPATIAALAAQLEPQATPEALDQLRILSGTPLYGTDIRDRDLPQETNQTRALHFAKGCYLGQEIVERIRSRGQVHRTFTGFILTGDLPPAGTILTADSKPAGELTSVTVLSSQLLAHSYQLSDTSLPQIALGYIRREALDRGASISYPGGTATPVSLPFQLTPSRPHNA